MQTNKNGRKTKLLAHAHTGKLRHHRHTSYGALGTILLLAFLPLISASQAVASAASGDAGTYAVVNGPVPATAPTITEPASGSRVTTSDPILIKGSCPANTLVKIFKNEVLAGATLCQNGSYSLKIDLFTGTNSLIARAYNTNDAAGPDSAVVIVQLLVPGVTAEGIGQLNTGAPAGQFYLTSQVYHRGVSAGETFTWPLILFGGQPPYAVSVSWGDGKTELYSRGDSNRFDISHKYREPAGDKGAYTIVVNATDQAGSQSYLQLVAIVTGDAKSTGVIGSITGGSNHSAAIRLAWQGLAAAMLVVVSFWLGERRQAYHQRSAA